VSASTIASGPQRSGQSRPPATRSRAAAATRDRILDAALASVASKGYDATSLDALGATLGVTKQTILHHFGSKDGLLRALVERSAADLVFAIGGALRSAPLRGRDTASVLGVVSRTVRAGFRLAAFRPELIALTREVARLGAGQTTDLMTALDPLTAPAVRYLQRAVRDGAVREHNSHELLMGTYARLIGAATEVEVMRQLGVEPPFRILVRRQNGLLDEIRRSLDPVEG
jgi:AcrR family transcriptional regulator